MKKKNDSLMKASEVGALVEGLRTDFRVFGDGLVFLREKVESLDTKFTSLDKKVEDIRINQIWSLERLSQMEKRTGSLETITQSLDRRMGNVETITQSLDRRMGNVETITQSLDRRTGNVETITLEIKGMLSGHDRRISHLEEVPSK